MMMAQAHQPFGQYEFNHSENQVLGALSTRVKVWGIIGIVIGGINALCGLFFFLAPSLLITLVSGVVQIVIGVTFVGAGQALSRVVETQGNDLAHLMKSAQTLSRAFVIQAVMTIVLAVLTIAAFLIAFVMAAAHHA